MLIEVLKNLSCKIADSLSDVRVEKKYDIVVTFQNNYIIILIS